MDRITRLLFVLAIILCVGNVLTKRLKHVKELDNLKQYKKILKTHTNVLTIYGKDEKSVLNMLKYAEEVAKEILGKGTIIFINCGKNKETKKLCKKFNVNPMPRSLKHYKDGSFHKDYDRKDNAKSLLTFMLNPTGDAPWEEDPTSKDVLHLHTEKDLIRAQRKEKGPMLIMFYAPWCGHCKKLKPDFSAAATSLKGKAVLAGMDVDKPDAHNVRYRFNITGYPTLLYFQNGEQKFPYGGDMNKAGIIEWMADPKEPVAEEKEPELPWSELAPEITHLTDKTFDDGLKEHQSLLVMFYAPWCGHCKAMKPEYVDAANEMKAEEIPGTLAAVDCTVEQKTCKAYDVKGYPTVKYFQNAEFKFKLSLRKKDEIKTFMKSPEEPPAPPPEDLPWQDVSGPEILHLEDHNFKDTLKKKKHVLVMFYAPWCGHCKKAKPEFQAAAQHFEDNRKVFFAGVDCTTSRKICEQYDVSGYPTFRYFLYGKNDFGYDGGRNSDAFIKFMEDPSVSKAKSESSSGSEWSDEPSSVVHLDDETFSQFINSNPSVLVMFYAPWCGHCKAMKPAYMQAANELLSRQHVLAALDCTKNRGTASKYNINGYPTLRYFRNGGDIEYEGARSVSAIVSFFDNLDNAGGSREKPAAWDEDSESSVEYLDDYSFSEYISEHSSVMVMFYAPWCGHCKNMKPAYIEAAKKLKDNSNADGYLAAIDCTANPKIAKKYDIRGYPTLKFFKDGKEVTKYKGERTADALVEFMKNPAAVPREPPIVDWSEEDNKVIHLTDVTFRDFIVSNPSLLVMFYAPWCGHCKKMKPDFAAAAEIVNGDEAIGGKLAALDCVKNPTVCRDFGIRGYPTLKYFKNGKDHSKYKGERTAKALVDFIKNPVADEETVKEWREEPSHIYHIDFSTFDEFIQKHDALVMFYAPWCGHCNTMKPAFTEAAQILHNEKAVSVLAAIDATKARDISSKYEVRGYPTLIYFRSGHVDEVYEQSRAASDIAEYIRRKDKSASHPTKVKDSKFEDLPSSVEHLSENSFSLYLKKNSLVLILFHSKACKTCADVQKEYMQAASRLSFSQQSQFAALSCSHNQELCKEKNIAESNPVIHLYRNSVFVEEYKGEVVADNLVKYVVMQQQKTEL